MQRRLGWILVVITVATTCVVWSPARAATLFAAMKKPAYARALTSLLDGSANLPSWTRELLKPNGAYVSGHGSHETIEGTTYEVFYVFPKGYRSNPPVLAVLFAPNGIQAWGVLLQDGTVSDLGNPSDAQRAMLRQSLHVEPVTTTPTGPGLSDVIKKPTYAQAMKSLLDRAGTLPPWTPKVSKGTDWYVESPVTHVVIEGTTYDIFWTCESQNCSVSQLSIMFAPNGTQAWGALFHEGTISYLGAPSPAQQWALRETLGNRTGK